MNNGQIIPTYQYVHYKNLKINPDYARLPTNLDEEKIIDFLIGEAATLELMMAIGENGYFPGEQLLVVEDEKESGKYIVIEGNRRLTAVKLLQDPNIITFQKSKINRIYDEAKYKPENIPCLIFKNKDIILKYLGFRHITGIKSWRLLEKARYLYNLKNSYFSENKLKDATKDLAKMIGSRSDYVYRLVVGYRLYIHIEENAFYKITDLNDTNFYFNYLVGILNKENIRNYINIELGMENPLQQLDQKNFEELIRWFFQKNEQNRSRVLGDSNGLKMLDAVLGSETALTAFKEGEKIERAYELTDDIEEMFDTAVRNSLYYLKQADDVVHNIEHINSSVQNNLKSMNNLIKKMQIAISIKSIENDQ